MKPSDVQIGETYKVSHDYSAPTYVIASSKYKNLVETRDAVTGRYGEYKAGSLSPIGQSDLDEIARRKDRLVRCSAVKNFLVGLGLNARVTTSKTRTFDIRIDSGAVPLEHLEEKVLAIMARLEGTGTVPS